MALISCPECDSEISDEANSCPNCGYPFLDKNLNEIDNANVKNDTNDEQSEKPFTQKNISEIGPFGWFIVIIIGAPLPILGLLSLTGILQPENNPNQPKKLNQDRPSRTMSKIMCEYFVEKRLKAPSTAEFASLSETNIRSKSKNVFIVSSHVDAGNPMGAKLRNDYVCKIKYQGNDKWKLINLKLK